MQIENSFYHRLQKLIWAAFIGVVSFQLIVPQIWGFMNKLAGISYSTGYTLFITGYTLIVPLLAVTWLLANYVNIKAMLFPVGKPETDKLCTGFLLAIVANCGVQFLICLVFVFANNLLNIPYPIFRYLQLTFLLFSAALLCIGGLIAWRRVKLIEPGLPYAKRKKLVTLLYQTLIACAAFLSLFVIWDFVFLANKGEKQYVSFNNHGGKGFQLLELKDKITSFKEAIDTSGAIFSTFEPPDTSDVGELRYKKSLAKDSWKKLDTIGNAGNTEVTNKKKGTNQTMGSSQKTPGGQLVTELPKIDSIIATVRKISSDSSLHNKDNLFNKRVIIGYLQALEEKSKSSAQKLLGATMRDHQSKILFALLNVFFSLLALYMFLQMNAEIYTGDLHEALSDKKIRETRLTADTVVAKRQQLRADEQLLALEKKQGVANGLTEGAWFTLVIAVWLLLPLFKPMANKDIDTAAPFKAFTFAPIVNHFTDPPARQQDCCKNCIGLDTSFAVRNIRYGDSISISGDTSINKFIRGYLITRIDTLQRRADSIFRKTDIIKNDTKHIPK